MRRRVPGRRDRLDLGVAELHDLAVGERRDGRTRRRRRPAGSAVAPVRSTSAGSPETWSACTCVSKHGDDRDALGLGQGDVVVDQVDVRIDDRELAVGLQPSR